jgi:hypothetical protein
MWGETGSNLRLVKLQLCRCLFIKVLAFICVLNSLSEEVDKGFTLDNLQEITKQAR